MRFILKVSGIFFLSILLIFTLAACGDGNKDLGEENGDNSSSSNENSSIVTGNTDNGDELDVGDIFGNDSSSQAGNSSENSSSESSSSENSSSNSSSQTSSDSGNSSGINYEDPSVWTDPV